MSWIESLAGKAETFLNLVDQAAGQALQADLAEQQPIQLEWQPHQYQAMPAIPQFSDRLPVPPRYVSSQQGQYERPKSVPYQNMQNNSVSVPSNLNRWNSDRLSGSGNFISGEPSAFMPPIQPVFQSTSVVIDPTAFKSTKSSRPDKDAALFEFLNTPDTAASTSSVAKVSPSKGLDKTSWNGKSYTTSSGVALENKLSTTTNGTPQISTHVDMQTNENLSSNQFPAVPVMSRGDSASLPSVENTIEQRHRVSPGLATIGEVSAIENENNMLRNEVASLNQELSSIIHRGNTMHDELLEVRQKLSDKGQSIMTVHELQARLADMQEAMKSKDTQLAVLRVRLEEADRELEGKRRTADQLQAHTNGMMLDQQAVNSSTSFTVEALRIKLVETEAALEHERAAHKQLQVESMERLNSLEADKQRLSADIGNIQRQIHDEKARSSELASQQKIARALSDTAKQELNEYKEKAMRILQSKDRLISSLRDGSAGSQMADGLVSSSELDGLRQERDMLRDELHQTRLALETAKLEVTELETQIQHERNSVQEQVKVIDDRLIEERNGRHDAEQETNKIKQELSKVRTETTSQIAALQSRLEDRDSEINRLRNQLTTKSLSANSQEELEGRLHMLTESLIQKQTMLETLNTEKNSLTLQLERMERLYREAESSAMRATASSVHVSDQSDARQRLPAFLGESPTDSSVTRRVKTAANSIDRFRFSFTSGLCSS